MHSVVSFLQGADCAVPLTSPDVYPVIPNHSCSQTLPEKQEVWCSKRYSCHWGGTTRRTECHNHNCIFKSCTGVSDASVHMDYYIVPLTKAQDGCKLYWDSRKQAARQVFTTPNIQSLMSCEYNFVLCDLIGMAVASSWASRVWAQPLFHGHFVPSHVHLSPAWPIGSCEIWERD